MITEITNQYNVDLSGDADNEVPVLNFTLPNNDWTLSIQVKGSLDTSEYGNLFQDGANYIFDSQDPDADSNGPAPRQFGAFNEGYFPIPELEALGEDEWATITITRVGNLLTYYVNGTNYGSITHSNLPSDIETINGWSGGGHHLAPDVANFRVFEGAATAEEVLELMEVPYTHVYGFSNRLFVDNEFVVASHRWVGGQKQGADFLDPVSAGDGWIYINDDNAEDADIFPFDDGYPIGRHALARAHTPDEKIQASAKLIGNGGDVDIVGNTYKLKIMSAMGQLIGEYDAVGTETGVKVADDVGFSFSNSNSSGAPFFEIYAEGEIYSDEQDIGINPPLEVVFNVVPNSSELAWHWADTTGSGPQSWYFHGGDSANHIHLRVGLQYWNGTSWSAPRALRSWTSGWENLPPEYTQGSPFEIGDYLAEIGWTGVGSQPLAKITFYNMMNNGADGNVNLTIDESPLVYFWNMETGTVGREDENANADGDTLLDSEDSHPDDFGMPKMQEPAPRLKLSDDDWAALSEDKTSPFQTDIHEGDLSLGQIFEIDRSQIGGGYDSQALGVRVRDADNNFVGLVNITDRGDSHPTNSIRYVLSSSEVSGFLTGYNGTAPSGEDTQLTVNESLLSSIRNALTNHFSLDINNIEGYEIAVSLKFYHGGREHEEVFGSSYGRGVFYIRPEMILEGYSEEAPDTSEEDDSDSDNGDTNETQPMEEIIMSEFNFAAHDLAGTVTETAGEGQDPTAHPHGGVANWSAHRKQVLGSALLAPGASLCGDLKMTDGGEIYLSDGTAASSLIKNITLEFGYLKLDGSFVAMSPSVLGIEEPVNTDGDFTDMGDDDGNETNSDQPDSVNPQAQPFDTTEPGSGADAARPAVVDAGDGQTYYPKWYIASERPNGSVVYAEMTPVNDLLDGIGGAGVTSILEALKEVEDLQEAFITFFNAEKAARIEDVEKLEAQMKADVATMVLFVEALESELRQHIIDGDAGVVSYVDSSLSALVAELDTQYADDRIAQIFTVSPAAPDSEFTITTSGPLEASRQDVAKWMIEVSVMEGDVRMNDKLIAFTSEIQQTGELKIVGNAGFCGDDVDSYEIALNAIYVGDSSLSPAYPTFNADDQGLAVSERLTHDADADADLEQVNLTFEGQ